VFVGVPTIAYLAEGKLYLCEPGKDARLIESPFAQQILERQERNRERHDWKSEGLAWRMTRNPLGMPAGDSHARQVRFSGIAKGASDQSQIELIYGLRNGPVGGLFVYTAGDGYERRLLHRNGFVPSDVGRHPTDGSIAVSLRYEDGTAHIGMLGAEGKGLRELTEGDAVDECPSWSTGAGRVLLYQSAGVARNAAGVPMGLGPYAIMRLDLDKSESSVLLESDQHDYLSPRSGPDGSLYYVRRPYAPAGHIEISPLKVAKDILLFPFRLISAIVHFLDWFSMVFRRKPLITASGPRREGPDSRYMMLWGKMIDAEKAMRGKGVENGNSLVPSTWEMVRRDSGGAERVLARGVVALDLCADGIIYTNGSEIRHQDFSGDERTIAAGRLIERVVAVT
jgi:hypothetical protein